MFDNPNIVEKIDVNENEFFLKIKNPQFDMMVRSDQCELIPVITKTEINLQNHESKTVFIVPFISRYHHCFVELFPLVLKFFEKVQKYCINDIEIILCGEAPIDEQTGIFVNLLDTDTPMTLINRCPVFGKSQSYIIEFFNYFKIPIKCVHSFELIGKSFDYTYIMYNNYERYKDLKLEKNSPKFNTSLDIPDGKILYLVEPIAPEQWIENISFLRKYLSKNIKKTNQKIYISRKNFLDRFNNEEKDVEIFFNNIGYKIVYFEEMNFIDQIKIVQESDVIVCMQGSSLLNCMMLNDQSKIVSLNNIKFNYELRFYKWMFEDNLLLNYNELFFDESVLEVVKQNQHLW